MELLVLLAQRPFHLVTREDILTTVWSGLFVGDAVLTNAISIIRRALGDSTASPKFVQTIPKRGYRLITPVLVRDDFPPESSRVSANAILLRARCLRQEETVSSVLQAKKYAEEVASLDPACSAAYAEIVLADLLLEKLGHVQQLQSRSRVANSVDMALKTPKPDALAYVGAAKTAYIHDWQWHEAERLFVKAIGTDPSDTDARTEFAIMLMNQRRFDEAGLQLRTAYAMDPLSPPVIAQLGHLHFYQAEMEAAVSSYEKLLSLSPAHLFGRWCLAAALEHSAQPDRARSTIEEGLQLIGLHGIPLLVTLCRVHLLRGDRDAAEGVFEKITKATADPLLQAHVIAKFGDRRRTVHLLEKAADQRHFRISDTNVLPSFRYLREDHGFRSLMKTIGVSG
jgi:DNA-binding winged helix-turn-helix (wHTH) protein/Flp pilus assembly protein TadD